MRMVFPAAMAITIVNSLASGLSAAEPVATKARYQVRVEHGVMVPMRDGKKLYADVIRPDSEGRFPLIIEYHPYRRGGYEPHRYFAERGFIGVRLDVRGTGGSDGINTDEYHPQEQLDGFDAVEWFARQPYCTGKVGMFGTSYGGFTALQVAMHQPPHLAAIAPMYATDDRYADDCHYTQGGNMRLYYDVGCYGGMMIALNALPPYPEVPGWEKLWQQRLEHNEPYIAKWMHQQVDGPYWKAASLRPNYDRVKCPVYLIAGWHDGYSNAMLRMYTKLGGPKKILIGPWVHARPDSSTPGPRIDYLNELCRFFGYWLRGEETGIMDEPRFTAYMQDWIPPERTIDLVPGHWRSDADFPAAGTEGLTFYLAADGKLTRDKPAGETAASDEYQYDPTVGIASHYWSGGMMPVNLAGDQRVDEARSLVFTTEPLTKEVRILGWPEVILHGSSSASVMTFVAKISDVAPDGRSALIADGSLNGTRRNSLDNFQPLAADKVYKLYIPMRPLGCVVAAGHRLRLALSSADFPNLWPTPERGKVRIFRGGNELSHVVLPTVPVSKLAVPGFLPLPMGQHTNPVYRELSPLLVVQDQITGTTMFRKDTGGNIFRTWVSPDKPGNTTIVGTHTCEIDQAGDKIRAVGVTTIRATEREFHIDIVLTVTKNGKPHFEKKWKFVEPRKML